MNAVGIDVSKGKSTVTIRRPGDIVVMSPRDIPHTQSDRLPHGFLLPYRFPCPAAGYL